MATVFTVRKSSDKSRDRSPLVRQMDEWQRVAIDARDKVLGQTYLNDIEEFYMLSDSGASGNPIPTFRPTIKIPELQTLMLYEANDLSESSPIVYITNSQTGEAENDREKTFQAEWRKSRVNYHSMFALLWSLFGGLGVLQLGLNPDGRGGLGSMWVKARNPKTYFPDPTTDYDLDGSFEIHEDYMHLDEIKRRWPLTSVGLKPSPVTTPQHSLLGPAGTGLSMPEGPMQSVGGLPSNKVTPTDTRLRVRFVYCKDYTRIASKTERKELPDGEITNPDSNRGDGKSPDLEWKYPNGRLIIECDGRILSDGDNPWPLGKFPTIPFWSMPPMFGIWGVPAVRYSVTLQNVAERLMTGVFENAVRLNNGVWFIHSNTGIDPEAFGGIPGEVCVINPNSNVPQCVFPSQMPAHFTQIPAGLLDRQKALQGFTPARSGNPGSGNLSPELYDESVLRSQGLTQLRGRLAAVSIQRFAELMFYTMCRFYTQKRVDMIKTDEGRKPIEWKPLDYGMQGRPDVFDVDVDEASIQPLSNTVLRKMAPELMKAKVLSVRRGLEMLNFPHSEEVAKEHEQEMALEALSRAKGVRR